MNPNLIRLLLHYLFFLPSSNGPKVIIFPVFSWDDVAYVIYETSGRVTSASEYGRDMYANALEKVFSNKTTCEETIFRALGQ